MYSLVQRSSLRRLIGVQAPALLSSLVIAEIFFKFHSFTLECLAFLATWGAFDWLISTIITSRKPS